MPRRSLDKGRRTEREVAQKLNAWAGGVWRFARRGLGYAGVPDIVAELGPSGVPWPYAISVKADRGPSLRALLERARDARRWWEWEAIVHAVGAPEHAWLVWKSDGAWLLSCGALAGPVSPLLAILPDPTPLLPRFTILFDAYLERVRPEHIARLVTTLEDFAERGRRAQEAVDRLTEGGS